MAAYDTEYVCTDQVNPQAYSNAPLGPCRAPQMGMQVGVICIMGWGIRQPGQLGSHHLTCLPIAVKAALLTLSYHLVPSRPLLNPQHFDFYHITL